MAQQVRPHPADAPLFIEVKNTFIDVRGNCDKDHAAGEDAAIAMPRFSKRGVSEPALGFQRQASGPIFTRLRTEAWSSPGTCLQPNSLPEEEESEGSGHGEMKGPVEPEAEKESGVTLEPEMRRQETGPQMGRQETDPQMRRQETDLGLPTLTFTPQSTDELWPSWGRQESAAAAPTWGQKESSFGRQESSFGWQESSFGRQESVLPGPTFWGRQEHCAAGAAWGRQESSFGRQESSFGRQESSFGRQESALPGPTYWGRQEHCAAGAAWGRQESSFGPQVSGPPGPNFEQKAHLRNFGAQPPDLPAVGRDPPGASPTASPQADQAPSARSGGPMSAGVTSNSPPVSDSNVPPHHWAGTSTVVVQNLPKDYTQQRLIEELNRSRFWNTFNFIHLPIDTERNATWGCAFINFKEPTFAWKFKTFYEGRKIGRLNQGAVVSIVPAMLQGFQANYEHYSRAEFNYRDPAARPLFLCEPSSGHSAPKRNCSRPNGGAGIAAMQQFQATMADAGEARPQQQPLSARPSVTAATMGVKAKEAKAAPRVDPGSASLPCPNEEPAASAVKAAAAAEQDAIVRFCPYCGGKCLSAFKFCHFCGSSLNLRW